MRTWCDCDEMGPCTLLSVDGGDELVQDISIAFILSKIDNINIDFFFFQFLCQLYHLLFISFNWRPESIICITEPLYLRIVPNKSHNPGLVVLALSVLQTQMCDLYARDKLHGVIWGNLVLKKWVH